MVRRRSTRALLQVFGFADQFGGHDRFLHRADCTSVTDSSSYAHHGSARRRI